MWLLSSVIIKSSNWKPPKMIYRSFFTPKAHESGLALKKVKFCFIYYAVVSVFFFWKPLNLTVANIRARRTNRKGVDEIHLNVHKHCNNGRVRNKCFMKKIRKKCICRLPLHFSWLEWLVPFVALNTDSFLLHPLSNK